MTTDLRQKLSEFFPPSDSDSDEVWQHRVAEAVLFRSIPGCIDGAELGLPDGFSEMLAWARDKKHRNEPITISARSNMFDISRAEQLIDKVVAAGHTRADLRWRMSPMQRRSLRRMLRSYAPLDELHRSTVSGDRDESGFFAGLFYVVDPSVGDSVVVLEVVREAERIGMVTDCGVEG